MKSPIKLIATLLLMVSTTHAQPTVFVNVNVIPMTTEAVLAGRTVIVADGRIETIGSVDETPVPEGGVDIVSGPESHENGKFAWIMDPDGNKVELWEPKNWDPKNKG